MKSNQCFAVLVNLLFWFYACGKNTPTLNSISFLSQQDAAQWVYLRVPSQLLTRSFVERTDFVQDHIYDDQFSFGYTPIFKLQTLTAEEQREVKILDEKIYRHSLFDTKSLALISKEVDDQNKYDDYHNYDQLTDFLQNKVKDYPDLVELSSAGKSVQGRELWYVRISDSIGVNENEPKFLYIANMHGDEVVGREMAIYLIDQLTNEYNTNPVVTELVNNSEVFIMPSMNPDGFELGQRWNANGRDLNRNFPDFTSDNTDSPDGRQPETQAIMKLHDNHHFLLAMNFHGGSVCINLPWDTIPNRNATERFGDDPLLQVLARQYADSNKTMRANHGGNFNYGVTYGYEWYEVDGGMQDWSSYYRRSIHTTLEFSYNKWPAAQRLPEFWQENAQGLLNYLYGGLKGIHLKIQDPTGNYINKVNVKVSSSQRSMIYNTPWLHRPTLPGKQTVVVEASGYVTKSIELEAKNFDGVFEKVILEQFKDESAELVMPVPAGYSL